ncbi:glycosyltransferase family 2 protein [Enterocloster citroniae]|nr:glycosyltransferase family 2 protein [Enterocloster citroniae]
MSILNACQLSRCKMIYISIIVPVYQAECYIERCLLSLLNQCFTNYEIICIDDGSTDKSAQIIKDFILRYPIIRYYYQPNKGVSAARNLGLSKASGVYVLFVDSDDILKKNAIKALYNKAKKVNAEILIFGGQADKLLLTPDWVKDAFFTKNELYNSNSITALFSASGARPSVCNKLFYKKTLDGLSFPEHISIGEDIAFLFMAFPKAENIVCWSKNIYRYQVSNAASAMNTIEDKRKDFFDNHLKTVEYIIDGWKRLNILDKNKILFIQWMIHFLDYVYISLNEQEKLLFKERLIKVFLQLDITYEETIQHLTYVPEKGTITICKLFNSILHQVKRYGFKFGIKSIIIKLFEHIGV